jgi:glycosyltransferase involved in cell wall biosynthesis
MRILLAIHNAYTDHTSGAAQSMRILMQWLADAGHDVRVLATARFDARPPANLAEHLAEHGVSARPTPPPAAFLRSVKRARNLGPGRPVLDFTLNGVIVRMLMTKAQPKTPASHFEEDQFLFLLDEILVGFAPNLLVTYGSHRVVQEAMRRARAAGVLVVFTLRNRGYDDRRLFDHVDHVFTTSPYLSEIYRKKIGLRSVGIESPIEWADVEAPVDLRRFVTFVNPSPGKGSLLFARLADMLGSARPDIPLLVVQSATTAGALNAIPGLDFTKYPHILAAPATPRPANFFALTRILLVPSTVPESFGRVAAEAMVNGIPPIVSDRGGLPETVGAGGVVLPLPDWLTPESREIPSEDEVRPWFETVCGLWDDAERYAAVSAGARAEAETRFAEHVLRRRYREYFTSLGPGGDLFD